MSALDEAKRVLAHPLHRHLANYLVPALAGLVAECEAHECEPMMPHKCELPMPPLWTPRLKCTLHRGHSGNCWALDASTVPKSGTSWPKKKQPPG